MLMACWMKIKELYKLASSQIKKTWDRAFAHGGTMWRHLVKHSGMYGLVAGCIGILGIPLSLHLYRVGSDSTEARLDQLQRQIGGVVRTSTNEGTRHLEKVISDKLAPFLQRMQEQNKASIARVQLRKMSPALRVFSEEPYGEFNCFGYEVFDVVREDENNVLLSNEGRNSVANLALLYGKKNGEITIQMDALRFNPSNPKASYKNYLDYLRFQKALMSNARLVFWDLAEDQPFLRTDHIMPVNMEYDYEKGQRAIDFYGKVARIEHWLGKKFPFQLKHTRGDVDLVNYVASVLEGKSLPVGPVYKTRLGNLQEKKQFLKSFWRLDMNGIEYRMERQSDVVKIFGVQVDLGMMTMDFPPATVTPSLEELAADTSDQPVTVAINVKNKNDGITLKHNTAYRNEEL